MSDKYAHYDRPKSNLPVNPDPAFYRSASSAADIIRAKQIENQRKTQSLPPPRGMLALTTLYTVEPLLLKKLSIFDSH